MDGKTSLTLPWPPSVNHYWVTRVISSKGRKPFVQMAIGSKGKAFRAAVTEIVWRRWPSRQPTTKRLAITITAIMPDRRKRDLDNILKATKDALTHAGFWEDDSQVDELRVIRGRVEAPGRMEILIEERT
jgi:crossover junction endodeoxyribonuclease RusA